MSARCGSTASLMVASIGEIGWEIGGCIRIGASGRFVLGGVLLIFEGNQPSGLFCSGRQSAGRLEREKQPGTRER